MVNNQRSNPTKASSLIRFFAGTYIISWAIWVPIALSSQGMISIPTPSFLGVVVGGISPSLIAIALTIIEEGKEGIQDLFARLLRWRIAIQWYLFALFAPAVIMLCAVVMNTLVTNVPVEFPKVGSWAAAAALFLITLILGGPLGEEIGWRGYVLPRLLLYRNGLLAGLIVGVFWGLWHLPLFWIRDSIQAGIPIGWFMISILAESILYTWVYISTRGSLVPAILFHAAVNTWAKLILLPLLDDNLSLLRLVFGLEIFLAVIVTVLARRKLLSKPGTQSAA